MVFILTLEQVAEDKTTHIGKQVKFEPATTCKLVIANQMIEKGTGLDQISIQGEVRGWRQTSSHGDKKGWVNPKSKVEK